MIKKENAEGTERWNYYFLEAGVDIPAKQCLGANTLANGWSIRFWRH